MKLRYFVPVLAAFAVLSLLPCGAWAQKIATVNPAEVFDKIQEKKDAQQDLDQKINKLKDEDTFKRKELESMKQQLGTLLPGSPQYKKLSEDLLKKAIEYDAWGKIEQANAQRNQKELMIRLYNKISHAVENEAKKANFDLVLAKQGADLPENMVDADPNVIRTVLAGRLIIYDAGTADLTQKVITEMDKAYLKGSATKP